ncbi:[protein-PII] uridylyltransferase [Sinimarinibacterium sp. NLF-5-8]|uniref:[protein-PII] uridylyltransferase n=1 Tax=Sinimarinibacterium sp. NLF-5-8 TaxID=2698684 RepID=UPI00137C3589|nr:[protein-PII] uridylyltransferase [Sinimarinibacterium sp. NLF-5-8]QHS08960.1 [protein-PII] uridylyltransferase [Sinimarinibacterium sp. NLF-5-8]
MSVAPIAGEDEAATLFGAARIRARLAQGGSTTAAFHDTLQWGHERLYSLFADGLSAAALVRARGHLVDEVLRCAWQKFLPDSDHGMALIAVGGYGRNELLPHSDIDLLLLYPDEITLQTRRSALEALTAFCWDIGLQISQSVRSVAGCVEAARDDLTVITNLIEARLLAGDAALFAQLQTAITPDQIWPVRAFFEGKRNEQIARHRKYDDTGYKLEPNVKESPGGLRDLDTIRWVTKRHFGAQTLHELRERGFLTKQECDELFAGQDFLWRVRFALHMLNGRHEDRLLFDSQIKVAALFGYVDTDHNKAVEQFMQLYYRTIKSLSCLNDMLLQLFEEAILHPDISKPSALNARFAVRHHIIEARDDEVFKRQPWALLEIFLLLQQHPKLAGIRAQTLRMILRDNHLLTREVRTSVKARALFMAMFRQGRGLTRNLRRMNRYGVLGRYIPEFGSIVGLMQFDLFHTLTVDEHILYVLRNARRFAMPRFAHEVPFCSEVMQQLPKPELLYLAAFWHDLGKGRGGDHSTIGAAEAEAFCLAHGLSHADAELVAWLVRQHLLMSLTAQKKDISDANVIAEFAGIVGQRSRLDYLFLLTCADIRGTNPALWNTWRAALLKDLYLQSARLLEGEIDPRRLEHERSTHARTVARALLCDVLPDATVDQHWARFDEDYFLRHSAEELAWQLPAIASAQEHDLPIVLVNRIDAHGTTVFVYTRDRDHLFGLSTGVLAKLGLNILDARLHTTDDGFVLDSYVVSEHDPAQIIDGMRREEIQHALRKVLRDPEASTVQINRDTPRRLRHFDTPTQVYFHQDHARRRTLLELITADQPGLLSLIGRVFQKRGLLLNAAKIATIGARAEDVFTITDRMHRPITDEKALNELRDVLIRTLDRRDGA